MPMPVTPDLRETRPASDTPRTTAPQTSDNAPLVLLVEDDPRIQELLADVLIGSGYRVDATDSALGAAALVRRLRPDIVLLDLGLPYRSGAHVLNEIKVDPLTSSAPVVVLPAMPETLSPERRPQADAVRSKPIRLHTLLAAVDAATSIRIAA